MAVEEYYPIVLYPKIIQEFIATESINITRTIDRSPVATVDRPLIKPKVKNKKIILYGLGLFAAGVILAVFGHVPKYLILGVGILAIATFAVMQRRLLYLANKASIKELHQHTPDNFNYNRTPPARFQRSQVGYVDRNDIIQRQDRLSLLLYGRITLPTGASSAQTGVSESHFAKYLTEYFGDLVQQGEELTIPGTKYKYSTDFSIVDRATGLRLDVEIDEPYEGRTKQPHHCSDDNRDTNRNHFFLNANWVVIRFSEEQVVCYPNSCCRAIAEVIKDIKGDDRYFQRLVNCPVLQPQRRWDNTYARQLAEWDYRLKYLKEAGVYFPAPGQSKQKSKRLRPKRKKY